MWSRLVPAAHFLAIPFGLTALEYRVWIEHGGGRELLNEIYEKIDCKAFPAGNTSIQMGGWFSKEIHNVDDLKGVRIRLSGIGAEALRALGADPVDLSPVSEEAWQDLAEGRFDAYENGGPLADMRRRLHERFKFYYYPAWHEPSVPFDLFLIQKTWQSLPRDLQAVFETASAWLDQRFMLEREADNAAALQTLTKEHGVELREYPREVLAKLREQSMRIAEERASRDPLSEAVFRSIMQFREKAARWAMVSHYPYAASRSPL